MLYYTDFNKKSFNKVRRDNVHSYVSSTSLYESWASGEKFECHTGQRVAAPIPQAHHERLPHIHNPLTPFIYFYQFSTLLILLIKKTLLHTLYTSL